MSAVRSRGPFARLTLACWNLLEDWSTKLRLCRLLVQGANCRAWLVMTCAKYTKLCIGAGPIRKGSCGWLCAELCVLRHDWRQQHESKFTMSLIPAQADVMWYFRWTQRNVHASWCFTDRKQASKHQPCQVPTALSLAAKLSGDKAAPEVSSVGISRILYLFKHFQLFWMFRHVSSCFCLLFLFRILLFSHLHGELSAQTKLTHILTERCWLGGS